MEFSLLSAMLTLSASRMQALDSKPEKVWYLAQFKPNCAMIAQRNLARQDLEVFLPMERRTRIVRQQLTTEIRPFFLGYLFVGGPNSSRAPRNVRSTYGVSQLVCFGGRPAIIPDDLVKHLRSRCDAEDVIKPVSNFSEGESVRLNSGPFRGLVGKIERADPDQRAWVLLDIMGQETKVSISQANLRATA